MRRSALVLLLAVYAVLLGVPFAARRGESADIGVSPGVGAKVVIVTPHNEQIRSEFGRAFAQWHRETFGVAAEVDWRAPGGTSEIRKLLESQYTRAVVSGRISPAGECAQGTMPYDIFFGGGAFEHDVVKKGVTVELPAAEAGGKPRRFTVPMSVPAGFSPDELTAIYGENTIGQGRLYDPEQYWLGAALTSFGIGFNRDVLRALGLPEPRTWEDLTDHRYAGWLAMTDPRQSGSVATTYDSILNTYGWEKGWRVLRGMAANARFFANTSLKPPLEISNGEAAAGPILDFYGRYQSQAVLAPGQPPESSRLGYIDPPGMVFIDSDPITILRGGPDVVTARRFVEFVLSERGQALWQFKRRTGVIGEFIDPQSEGAQQFYWGPEKFELRRMPVRRSMYENHRDRFADRDLRPFESVSTAPMRGWRSMIIPMFSAFAIDIHAEMREAWDAMARAKDAGAGADLLERLDALFYAMPPHPLKSGGTIELNAANYAAVRDEWRDARREPELRMAYTAFFRANYKEIVRAAHAAGY